jgi:hypothetical protein
MYSDTQGKFQSTKSYMNSQASGSSSKIIGANDLDAVILQLDDVIKNIQFTFQRFKNKRSLINIENLVDLKEKLQELKGTIPNNAQMNQMMEQFNAISNDIDGKRRKSYEAYFSVIEKLPKYNEVMALTNKISQYISSNNLKVANDGIFKLKDMFGVLFEKTTQNIFRNFYDEYKEPLDDIDENRENMIELRNRQLEQENEPTNEELERGEMGYEDVLANIQRDKERENEKRRFKRENEEMGYEDALANIQRDKRREEEFSNLMSKYSNLYRDPENDEMSDTTRRQMEELIRRQEEEEMIKRQEEEEMSKMRPVEKQRKTKKTPKAPKETLDFTDLYDVLDNKSLSETFKRDWIDNKLTSSFSANDIDNLIDKMHEKFGVSMFWSSSKHNTRADKIRYCVGRLIALSKRGDISSESPLGIKGFGLKKKRVGRPRGSGMPKQERVIIPNFVGFGINEINQKQLKNGIVKIRRNTKTSFNDMPSKRVSSNLQGILKTISGGGIPNYNDLGKLDEEEKNYLNKLISRSNLTDRISVPAPSKDQQEKDIHNFEVMKGQLMSGNDSQELVKKFKLLIRKLSKQGLLPKSDVDELSDVLLDLGY